MDYDALDPVVDAEQALTDASILHADAGTNKVWNGVFEYGDVEQAFQGSRLGRQIDRMHFHRFSSTPLENNVVIAQWDPKDERIYYSVQQLVSIIRHPVSCRAPRRAHRSHSRADFRYRRQLRDQNHELSADGGVRAGFKKSRWPADQSGWRPARNT